MTPRGGKADGHARFGGLVTGCIDAEGNLTRPYFRIFFGVGKVVGKAFFFKADSPDDLIAKIVEMADAARKGGFLALEEADINNSFMQKGVDMLVDGHDIEVVRSTPSTRPKKSCKVKIAGG